MAAAIQAQFGVEPDVKPGNIGSFDVIVDGERIFSKFKSGRFPDHQEIINALRGR
ncbi:MAG: SelT/SelW/SelH family protein [Chloroflexi bacterium]|nr:SelT/SelW/SelH family protein [Chloroflexota bacterium]